MTAPNNFQIDITVPEQEWETRLSGIRELAESCVQSVINKAPDNLQANEISIVFANNSFIQDLNLRYREQDKPTNVLSFPQNEGENLGDIILALETITQEAQDQNKSLEHHVSHLIVHGTLHLLGHDHENEDEADDMEALEISVLETLGIKNPYETEDSVS